VSRLWRSLSFRLAVAYAGLLCLSTAVLFGVYYWLSVERPLDEIRVRVSREAQVLAQVYIADGEAALVTALNRRAHDTTGRRAFHAFLAPDGKLVTGNLPSWPEQPSSGWLSLEADVYRDGDELDFSALARDRVFPDGARLIVGRDAEDVEDVQEIVQVALPWVTGLTLLFGCLGGFFMSRAIGRRLDAISATARQVIGGDLGGRIATEGRGDDFDRLVETLNLMLSRNQELFEAVRRVSDSVAHELRTPLARLLAQLERLGENDGDGEARRSAREAALAEAQRLNGIFDALLRISRIEGGRHNAAMRPVDLAVLARDACELYAPAAQARGIELALDIASGAMARADPDLLFQALTNLVDNALKYTPEGGRITIAVDREAGKAVVSVSDDGVGLQPGEAERIAERFFRGADTRGAPGEGLGLSLVSAIVALHNGRLRFIDNRPGLRAGIALDIARP